MTPYDHRVNAVEKAIQNFKNHTISGLCICDEAFPSILWCKLIQQSQDTLTCYVPRECTQSCQHSMSSKDSMNSTECHLDHPTQEELFSIHQRQEDPKYQEHWTAGTWAQHGTITAACIFKSHKLADTEHQNNTSCNPHMSKYRGKHQFTGL